MGRVEDATGVGIGDRGEGGGRDGVDEGEIGEGKRSDWKEVVRRGCHEELVAQWATGVVGRVEDGR